MNFSQVLTIAISLLNFFLAVVVLWRNRRSIVNISFFLFTSGISFWGITYVVAQTTGILFWGRLVFVFGLLMGGGFLLFAKTFPRVIKKLNVWQYILFFAPILLLIILLFSTGLILEGFTAHENNLEPKLGPAYYLLIVYVVFAVIYGIISLIIRYRRADGIEKLQLKYLLFGLTLFSIAAVTVNVILPTIGIFQLNSLGPIFSIFLVVAVAYSIVKHRLMDIRIVLKKAMLHILVSLTFLIFILGSIFAVAHFLAKRIPDLLLVFTGSITMVIALMFLNPLRGFFEKLANKYFFTSLYNYQATLEELATKLTAVIEMPRVINLIVDTIMKTMGLDRAGVLLLSNERNANRYVISKVIGFNEQNGISLVRDNFLVQWLINNRKMVVYEELDLLIEESRGNGARSSLMRLKTNMNKIEASLCIPLMSQDKLISIIVLGNKVTSDAYTVEDFKLLQTISNQAVVAVENARLYQQVQDFNKNLQAKVSEQTQDIKDKNLRLEKLLQIRSEFLDIASHQLRTPVSVIRGVLSMIREGDLKKLPKEKQDKFIENAWQKGAKLDTIINDILAASELDTQKFQVDSETKTIQLEDVVDQVVNGFKLEAEERGTELKWSKPKSPLSKVKGHVNFLEQALSNLIGNALKYTPSTSMVKEARSQRETKGVVEVAIGQEKNDIVVKVKDNGIGIPKDEIKKLFDKFARASNATAMYTDGSGLGLFIVKEIIEGHRGKVWVESVENKGSTFYASLPIVEK